MDRIPNKIKNIFEFPSEEEGFSDDSHLKTPEITSGRDARLLIPVQLRSALLLIVESTVEKSMEKQVSLLQMMNSLMGFLPLFTNKNIKTFHKLLFEMPQREGKTSVDIGM